MERQDAVTVATYAYLLHRAGISASTLAQACARIDAADESAVATLVEGVQGDDPAAALAALYGGDRLLVLTGDAEADRDARVSALRRALFGTSLPFLARIAHREQGVLGERWVIVESFGVTVRVLDPNPWDDKDEAHELGLAEFVVRWELGGGAVTGLRG